MFMLIRRSRDASSFSMSWDTMFGLCLFTSWGKCVYRFWIRNETSIADFFIIVHILWNSSRKSEIHPLHLRPLLAPRDQNYCSRNVTITIPSWSKCRVVGWGIEGKQVGSMDEESQVRGCYNITFICTPTNQETVSVLEKTQANKTFRTWKQMCKV